ncbi:MAG TPA: hypothetical protein VKE24_03815 [Candidatus Acidoferrales bacterium]|nr:hypothetical protein [Candidatus Acidoferrales bacterium]
MLTWDLWNAWKLRVFLIGGLAVIAMNLLTDGVLDLDISVWLSIYLFISGLYFAIDPQDRVVTRWQEWLVRLLFPGAFVTTLLPLYALALFLIRSGWF